ncbi:hypothetical protein KIPB_004135 [Kipferlia bialata]|uniref:Uncharacterized protein n=1 Tax=Kipferlia bialata TaxID=797122 RepID=A0A391P1T9_9EUKA|nr:hypothetical protein KIPB_004135 [Kipferlia bialata]|eukprot:g4135.t1
MPAPGEGPSKWDGFKGVLKKAGIATLGVGIPVAISMATGGLAIPALSAVLPLANTVTQGLRRVGMSLPVQATAETLAKCLGGAGGDIVGSVFGLVKRRDVGMAPVAALALTDMQVKAQIEEVLRPELQEYRKV